jgi:pSer/pThr/pTyr-binding forkhead associated (FHA) protein
MKVRLIVASGPGKGKVIAVAVSPFLIGRNPVCQLRPASVSVSSRHCTIWLRQQAAFVQDMASTNGTMVNGERITAERELRDGDRLQVGPLLFDVQIEAALPVDQRTPLPPSKKPSQANELEDAAAMILFEADSGAPPAVAEVDASGVPTGSTLHLSVPQPAQEPAAGKDKERTTPGAAKQGQDTATAANAILKQYMRRPRK